MAVENNATGAATPAAGGGHGAATTTATVRQDNTTFRNCLQEQALAYAAAGLWVFPCLPGTKDPATRHGFKDATIDPAQIRAWWKEAAYNIACDCGRSGLVVVDKDVKNGVDGLETWRDIRQETGADDDTVTQKTPSGGEQLLYAAKDLAVRNSAGRLGPGLDIRGDGGYILLPPSKTVENAARKTCNGAYTWAADMALGDIPLKPFPVALARLLTEQKTAERRAERNTAGIIPKGRQHHTLASLAGTMRARGMTAPEIDAALQVVNANRLEEPAPEDHITKIAAGIAKYPPGGPYAITDLGNAERFAAGHGERFRYVDQWGWLVYDGKRWARDLDGERFRSAKDTVRLIYHEAGECLDDDRRKAVAAWARTSESQHKLDAMLTLARWEQPIAARVEHFDRDIYLLNVDNGTVDLRTGELRPHDPADLITKLAPVPYEPGASAPVFTAFLARSIPSPAVRAYLKRWNGYSATGSTREERLSIWHGAGQNGKTTLARTVQNVLGDFARQIDPAVLMAQRGEQHPTGKASLYGVRCAFAVETTEGRRFAESAVKALTSNDKIAARFMRQDFFDFVPTHSLALLTNHKPEIRGTDYGMWRRVDLVPWTVVVPDSEKDPDLPEKLRAEAAGVLAWIVEGAGEWYREGLPRVAEITAATEEYRTESDLLGDFLTECCVLAPEATATVKALYAGFSEWCKGAKEEPIGKNQFGSRLRERGLVQSKSGVRRWQGIRLAEQGELDIPEHLDIPGHEIRHEQHESPSCSAHTENSVQECPNVQDDAPDEEAF